MYINEMNNKTIRTFLKTLKKTLNRKKGDKANRTTTSLNSKRTYSYNTKVYLNKRRYTKIK